MSLPVPIVRGMDVRPTTGRIGEDAAELLYVRRGYRVVARNWRCRIGELDLVLRRGEVLVFCEVKARRGSRFGGGFEAVDRRKQQKVRSLAQTYLLRMRAGSPAVRFDVASVFVHPDGSASVQLFEDAF